MPIVLLGEITTGSQQKGIDSTCELGDGLEYDAPDVDDVLGCTLAADCFCVKCAIAGIPLKTKLINRALRILSDIRRSRLGWIGAGQNVFAGLLGWLVTVFGEFSV